MVVTFLMSWAFHHSLPFWLYMLRVELEDWDGNYAYADFSNFHILEKAHKYKLLFDSFEGGNAGDVLNYHNNTAFSTWDQDNDGWHAVNCAETWTGAWWYDSCQVSNLNGHYYTDDGGKYDGWHGSAGKFSSPTNIIDCTDWQPHGHLSGKIDNDGR